MKARDTVLRRLPKAAIPMLEELRIYPRETIGDVALRLAEEKLAEKAREERERRGPRKRLAS